MVADRQGRGIVLRAHSEMQAQTETFGERSRAFTDLVEIGAQTCPGSGCIYQEDDAMVADASAQHATSSSQSTDASALKRITLQ